MNDPSAVTLPAALNRILAEAKRMVALTGAGTSAESGINTFRQKQTGLWARYRPQDLATPEAFARNPKRVWDWYQWRRQQVLRAQPNAGHHALAELEQACGSFAVITQNVDGLHQRAGSRRVLELHGSILRYRCHRSGCAVAAAEIADSPASPPPSPHHAQGLVRPDVVWFGESLDAQVLAQAAAAVEACQVLFSIGTSSVVEPAASLARLAQRAGACVVEINPERTPLSADADFVLSGFSGEIVPAIAAARRAHQHL